MEGRYDQFKPKKQKSTVQINIGSPSKDNVRESNLDISVEGNSNEKSSKAKGN